MPSPSPIFSIEYLDTLRTLPEIQKYKTVSYQLLAIEAKQKILEVGCATGEDVRTVAQQVGKKGQVVGIDISEVMIAEARQRTEDVALPIEFLQGDAEALDFADDSFDSCRAERLLHFLDNPLKALQEMARVVRPGGHIVVGEPDWATLILQPPGPSIDVSVFEFDQGMTIGRRLPALFKKAKLEVLEIVPVTCVITDFALANQVFHLKFQITQAVDRQKIPQAQALEWLLDLAESTQKGEFLASLTGFVVCGRVP